MNDETMPKIVDAIPDKSWDDSPIIQGTIHPLDTNPQERPRITVVEQIYHSLPGEQPFEFREGWSEELSDIEQVYSRIRKGKGEWEDIESGWVSTVGTLLVYHKEKTYMVEPSPEQRLEDQRKRVVIGIKAESLIGRDIVVSLTRLSPGKCFRIEPFQGYEGTRYMVSADVDTTIRIIAIPR